MRTLAISVAFAILLGAFPAAGQVRVVRYGDDRLSGITEVDVLVTVAADASGRCAVDRTAVASIARDALQQSRIRATVSEKRSSWFYSVLITVATSRAGGQCAASVETDLVAEVQGSPEADRYAPAGAWGSLLVGQMSLLKRTDLMIGPIDASDEAVRRAVHAEVAAIAEKLRAANP